MAPRDMTERQPNAAADEPHENPVHPPVEGPESGLPHGEGDAAALARDLAAARAEIERLAGDAAAARREAEDALEKLKRTLADFENFRRRSRGEALAAREKAKEDLLRELLHVLDNFDRALEHDSGDEESLYEGVKLIFRQFRGIVEKEGLTRIDTEGHAFDPLVHEAVMREPTASYKPGTVIKELERGYFLNGRVLRPAKVKVAVAQGEGEPGEPGEPPAG